MAGMSDWSVSLSRCEKLSTTRMLSTVLCVSEIGGFAVTDPSSCAKTETGAEFDASKDDRSEEEDMLIKMRLKPR